MQTDEETAEDFSNWTAEGHRFYYITKDGIVKEYSESIYLEVAARNLRALKLYHKNGYNCLNTVTVRKDFEPDNFEVIEKNNIAGFDFEIKRYVKKEE